MKGSVLYHTTCQSRTIIYEEYLSFSKNDLLEHVSMYLNI